MWHLFIYLWDVQSFVLARFFPIFSCSLFFLSFCNPTISKMSLSKFQDATQWSRYKIFNIFQVCHSSQKKCYTSLKWQRSRDVSSRHWERTNPVVSGLPTNKYCQNWNWQGEVKQNPRLHAPWFCPFSWNFKKTREIFETMKYTFLSLFSD